ncbi:MAG: EpsG family protein [Bacteroidaceae bacterium]|nr:EpsG family protein [Bacteroidaceae bacterium]
MAIIIFSLFAVVCCLAFLEDRLTDRTKFNALLLLGLFMAFAAGLRPDDIDHDYATYTEMYYNSFSLSTEISFTIIVSFVQLLFDNVVMMFLIYALISMFVHFYGIRKLSSLIFLSLMVYISNYYLLHEMNQIRVGVASGIFLIALYHLGNDDKKKFLLYALFATFFHYTASVLFLFYFFDGKPMKKWQTYFYLSIIPAAYVIYFLHMSVLTTIPIPHFEEKMKIYQALQANGGVWDEINVFNLVLLTKIAMTLFILWKSSLIYEYNKYVYLLLKVEIISIAAWVALYEMPVVAMRMSELLGIVEIVLFPMLFYTVKPAWLGRVLVTTVASVLLFISLVYNKVIYI